MAVPLASLVERGVSVAATSNMLPEKLGESRLAAEDFLREINTPAEGPGRLRHRRPAR